tara:strand:- start:8667 stop:9854 length:1188 start_codon:yes stop_codon:yes gene_type:complete
MKVLMLTTGFPRFVGDLFGSFVSEQANALSRCGVQVAVLAPHEKGLARRESTGVIEVFRFRYAWPVALQRLAYRGGIPTNLRNSWWVRFQVPFFLLGFLFDARRRGQSADLVHCHWIVSGLVAVCALGRSKKLILSVRGSDINMLSGRWGRRLNRSIANRMDRVIAVSEDIAKKLADAGVERRKISVIHNGVDGRFCPGDRQAVRDGLQIPPDSFVMIFVGLLIPVKGIDILIEALSQWRDRPKWNLYVVGDGPLLATLKERCEEEGIASQVHFVGRRSSQDVPQWMQAADVLVLPSHSEGRPNVVLEAQACGLPVVATCVGGTPELIRDGETGLLVEPGAVIQLREALQTLHDDGLRRVQMGEQARAHVETCEYTWEHSAATLHALYRSVLEGA